MSSLGDLGGEQVASMGSAVAPMVSVILPVCNGERYLAECVDSVLAQTMGDFELICVDDGSTDGTAAMLDAYAERDARVRVFHRPNAGYGAAVNFGIDCARGTYVGLIESDDYMLPEMLEVLLAAARESDADVVKCDYYEFVDDRDGRHLTYMQIAHDRRYYGPVHDSTRTTAIFYPFLITWAGLHRRSFLNEHGIRHHESPGASFQDNGFWFQEFTWATQVRFVNRALVCYRIDNPAASTKQRDLEKLQAMFGEFDFIERFLAEHPEQDARLHMTYLHFRFDNILSRFFMATEEARPVIARALADELSRAVELPCFDWAYFGGTLRRYLKAVLADSDAFAAAPPRDLNEICYAEMRARAHIDVMDANASAPTWLIERYLAGLDRAWSVLPMDADALNRVFPECGSCASFALDADVGTAAVGARSLAALVRLDTRATGDYEIRHDQRHAPYVDMAHAETVEQQDSGGSILPACEPVLISLADEGPYAAALAFSPSRVGEGSAEVQGDGSAEDVEIAVPSIRAETIAPGAPAGVGIDIAAVGDFKLEGEFELFYAYLFTLNEVNVIQTLPREDWPGYAAQLFAVKESIVKSVAPLVRRAMREGRDFGKPSARCKDIEVTLAPDGTAHVSASGTTAERFDALGVRGFTAAVLYQGGEYAVAVARCDA